MGWAEKVCGCGAQFAPTGPRAKFCPACRPPKTKGKPAAARKPSPVPGDDDAPIEPEPDDDNPRVALEAEAAALGHVLGVWRMVGERERATCAFGDCTAFVSLDGLRGRGPALRDACTHDGSEKYGGPLDVGGDPLPGGPMGKGPALSYRNPPTRAATPGAPPPPPAPPAPATAPRSGRRQNATDAEIETKLRAGSTIEATKRELHVKGDRVRAVAHAIAPTMPPCACGKVWLHMGNCGTRAGATAPPADVSIPRDDAAGVMIALTCWAEQTDNPSMRALCGRVARHIEVRL